MKKNKIFFVFIISLFLINCTSNSTIQNKTLNWILDRQGYTQYYTNDPANCDTGFFHFVDDFQFENHCEVEVKKNSGSPDWGFGFSLCLEPGNLSERYAFIITTNGFYYIGEVHKGGGTSPSNGFVKSEFINTGYGVSNFLLVKKNGYDYSFYVNSNHLCTFTSNNINANFFAFGLDVGNNENFPKVPVDVRFKIIKK